MKYVYLIHGTGIGLILFLCIGIYPKLRLYPANSDYDTAFARAIPIVDQYNTELLKAHAKDLKIHPSSERQAFFEQTKRAISMLNAFRAEVQKNETAHAAPRFQAILDTVRAFNSDPTFWAALTEFTKNTDATTATAWDLTSSMMANRLLWSNSWWGGDLDGPCAFPYPKMLSEKINPRVGDTTTFKVILTCDQPPLQYLELNLNGASLTVNDKPETLNDKIEAPNDKSIPFNISFEKPGLYPLRVAGSVSLSDSDSIARFDKTYFLWVK